MKKFFCFLLSAFLCVFTAANCKKTTEKEMNQPKKYFTLSFDDGTHEDEKLIALLKKYDISATFCINTGLMDGNDVIEVAGNWRRMDFDYAKDNSVYDGFDVISHAYTHKEFTFLSDDQITAQIENDSAKIAELTGKKPVGAAYTGGTAYYDDHVISVLLSSTDVRFARDTDDTYGFSLPNNFMAWKPTCSLLDDRLMQTAKRFVEATATEDMLFYGWDHPWAITAYNAWNKVERFLKYISEQDDIVCVTNTRFYELYKNKIKSKGLWE